MSVDLSEKDHNLLDKFLADVLDRYKSGSIGRTSAVGLIAEAVALVANDNGNVVHYMTAMLDRKNERD